MKVDPVYQETLSRVDRSCYLTFTLGLSTLGNHYLLASIYDCVNGRNAVIAVILHKANPIVAIPDWKLPPGVPRGVWDYTKSRAVADDYDEYHAFNTLFEFEEKVLEEEFGSPPADGVIADLGCGTGRALVPFVRKGWHGLAIDLSQPMLDVVQEKAELENLSIDCLQANLVELDSTIVSDQSATHAICLFSTLGMISGRENRITALRHMHRILKPGGKLVLHVHNFWFNLRDPEGPGWVIRSLVRSWSSNFSSNQDDFELGDKTFPYRGLPNFFLHVFRRRELLSDLGKANLEVVRWIPLDVERRHALKKRWLFPSLRANGWIIVVEKKSSV